MAEFRAWGGAALITGGSAGIGLEIARQFARRGVDLVLVSRSSENLRIHAQKLSAAHGIRAEAIAVDLATVEGPAHLMEALRDVDLNVDVLVNNAGFGIHGGFAGQGPEREAEMVRLNASAPVELAARLLNGMLRRRHGLILNVASTAAFQPVPWISSYAATKVFLVNWTIALDAELKGSGVRASVLCPGTTDTNFLVVSGARKAGQRTAVFGQQTPAQVAEECLRGIDRGQRIIVTGGLNRIHARLASLLPRSLAVWIADRALRPSKSGGR